MWPWLRWLHSVWATISRNQIQGAFTVPPTDEEIERFFSEEASELDLGSTGQV
jgi:hypothetical protein